MKYVTRAQWGARPRKCSEPLPPIDTIVFHYTASNADEQANHANCAQRVRGVQKFHQDARGWCDIAYNFVVCKHGYVFEGRGYAHKAGATGDANSHTIAVCFLGDDTRGRDDLTVNGRKALVDIATEIQRRHTRLLRYAGHRDFMSTSCPGDEIYGFVTSQAFQEQVRYGDKKRLAALRKWILARRGEGWSWKRIKLSPNWREFRRRGGR